MSLLASRRVMLHLAAGMAGFSGLAALPALAADPAADVVQKASASVIEVVKTKTGAEREAGIRQVLQEDFDLAAMGRAALGTHWAKATEEQRQRYLKAVAEAEAHSYSERFGQYMGQLLTVDKVTPRPNGAFQVDSKLSQKDPKDPPVKLQWEVRDTGHGPRIVDVKVEGVSMVMTRRTDFNSYIQNHGGQLDALIAELESRATK